MIINNHRTVIIKLSMIVMIILRLSNNAGNERVLRILITRILYQFDI